MTVNPQTKVKKTKGGPGAEIDPLTLVHVMAK
jgi:hypothetical protein